ncbi:nucleotidyltransferase domain-containing protein [Williamsia sp. R60]
MNVQLGSPSLDPSKYAELARRREHTRGRWTALSMGGRLLWPKLEHADRDDTPHISNRACIYVTGSVARDEASEASDLDLFVLDDLPVSKGSNESRGRLNYVESARLIEALDELRGAAEFRPFSRGGEFIQPHSFMTILSEIGAPTDDASNSFTARLLLLMNSRPLLNADAYDLAREQVLSAYWDRSSSDDPFFPIMLTNDIRRWWGVLCLNFERYNRRMKGEGFKSTPKRRMENLKLRYSKLLGVYSTILDLVDRSASEGLTRISAQEVFDSLPIDRVLNVSSRHPETSAVPALAHEVLSMYNDYLTFVATSEDQLLEALADDTTWKEQQALAFAFHEKFVRLFSTAGQNRSPLYEYCIV